MILAVRDVAALLVVNGAAAGGHRRRPRPGRPDPPAAAVAAAGETRCCCGRARAVTLTVANPGRRMLRADVRDAWQPSAGARTRTTCGSASRGRPASRLTTTHAQPSGATRRRPTVTIRSLGPLGLAARQAGRTAPWTVRVLPPFRSRRHLPEKLSRLRQLDGQHRVAAARPGQRVRLPARVRHRRRRRGPSTGGPPRGAAT